MFSPSLPCFNHRYVEPMIPPRQTRAENTEAGRPTLLIQLPLFAWVSCLEFWFPPSPKDIHVGALIKVKMPFGNANRDLPKVFRTTTNIQQDS